MRVFVGLIKKCGGSLVALALLLNSFAVAIPVLAANENFSAVADKNGSVNSSVAITDLQITGTGNEDVDVNLYMTSGELSFGSTSGLTFNSAESGTNLQFSGSRSNVNAALLTLEFRSSVPGTTTIEVRLGGGDGDVYNPANGHVYQVIAAGGEGIDWHDAKTAAEAMTNGGVNGYLATITSQEEHQFIYNRISQDGWIGANDIASEGVWRWKTGPEAAMSSGQGLQFWTGNGATGTGVNGVYSNWNQGGGNVEPNNGSGNEDCAEIRFSSGANGQWNDRLCEGTNPAYVVEYGTSGNLPLVASTEFDVTVSPATLNIASCDQLFELTQDNQYDIINLQNDIDCSTVDNEFPLFHNEDYPFMGILTGNGHTIRNLNFVYEDDNIALFGRTNGASISNVRVDNIYVYGGEYTAALIGQAVNTDISDVHVTNATIESYGSGVGGLVAEYLAVEGGDAHITRSSVTGKILTGQTDIGGLVGFAGSESSEGLLIEQVYADVDITLDGDSSDAGGLIGELEVSSEGETTAAAHGVVRDAYTWGALVTNYQNVGGLIGRVDIESYDEDGFITIERTYARGNVTGNTEVGGLIGQFDESDSELDTMYTLNNNFAMGKVTSTEVEYVGGLFGFSDGAYEDERIELSGNFFDVTRTAQSECSTEVAVVSGCSGLNADNSQANYFVNNSANAPMNTWDFDTIWVANEGIPPIFRAMPPADIENTITEANGPNNGDANNDGTPDENQANVTSIVDPATGKYVALAVDEQCSITSVSMVTEQSNVKQDASYEYPVGLMDFTLDCGDEGFTTPITQYYYGITGSFIVRKYNSNTNTYQTITSASVADQTIGGQQAKVASYEITDGGELDMDGEENGKIVDPAGLARVTTAGAQNLAKTGMHALVIYATAFTLLATSVVVLLKRRKFNSFS